MQQQLVERPEPRSQTQSQAEQSVEQVLKEEKETTDLAFEVLDVSDGVTVQRTETVLEATATLHSDGQRDIQIDENVFQDTFTVNPTYDVELPDAWNVIATERQTMDVTPAQWSPWDIVQLHQQAVSPVTDADTLPAAVQPPTVPTHIVNNTYIDLDAAVDTDDALWEQQVSPEPVQAPVNMATMEPYEEALTALEPESVAAAPGTYAIADAADPSVVGTYALPEADVAPDEQTAPLLYQILEPGDETVYAAPGADIITYEDVGGGDSSLETHVQARAPDRSDQRDELVVLEAYDVAETANGMSARVVYGATDAVTAVDLLEDVFSTAALPGTVETLTYESSEQFTAADGTTYMEGETVEAQYVDLAGADMDRTEYFINGELATDAIEAYDLGPDDTLTFVESPVFADGGGHGGTMPTLDEVAPTAETVYEVAVEDAAEGGYSDGAVMEDPIAPAYTT